MKRLYIIIVVLICTYAVRAQDTLDRSKTLILQISEGIPLEQPNFNPFTDNNREDGFHQVMMEPLFMLNYATGEIMPWLGLSMTPNETLDVWTLTLRDGVTWSDGEPFTAKDVVFTINMLREHAAPELRDSLAIASAVKDVEQVDDLTVRFTLTTPNPRFQLDFWSVRIYGSINIVPEHIWRDIDDPLTYTNGDLAQRTPVFTGPYLLESYDSHLIVYRRNDHWWGAETGWKPLPAPERIVFKAFDSSDEALKAFEAGELDSLYNPPFDDFLQAHEANPHIISYYSDLPYAWVPDPCARNLEFNTSLAPWDNATLRWAVNFAIDRDAIVAFVYNGTTIASRHFFPAYPALNRYVDLMEEAGLYDRYPLLDHDPSRAREMIEEQGWTLNEAGYYEKDGQELSLEIIVPENHNNPMTPTGELIAEQLNEVGIRAVINDGHEMHFYHEVTGDYQAAVSLRGCDSVSEPWDSLDNFNVRWVQPIGKAVGPTENVWRWSGTAAEQYSAVVDEMGRLPLNDPQIDTLFLEAMEIWMPELPIIPLNQASIMIAFNDTYWQGWPTAENNFIQPAFWWQSTHEIIHHLEPAAR